MQPTPLIAIQSRLDLPDPARCGECRMPKSERSRRRRRRLLRRR